MADIRDEERSLLSRQEKREHRFMLETIGYSLVLISLGVALAVGLHLLAKVL